MNIFSFHLQNFAGESFLTFIFLQVNIFDVSFQIVEGEFCLNMLCFSVKSSTYGRMRRVILLRLVSGEFWLFWAGTNVNWCEVDFDLRFDFFTNGLILIGIVYCEYEYDHGSMIVKYENAIPNTCLVLNRPPFKCFGELCLACSPVELSSSLWRSSLSNSTLDCCCWGRCIW